MSFLQIILFPFSVLYSIGANLRNLLYDVGLKKTYEFDIPIISVGNLSVGGTGKTPAVEYLIELLADSRKIAVLSRGYKRRTKGFLQADGNSTIDDIGDEPFQVYRKFKGKTLFFVGEDRAAAINKILSLAPEIDCVILDDAFQHRRVGRKLNILLNDFSRPFYDDYVLPSGRLRESRSGANRSDVVIITKIPNATVNTDSMKKKIEKYLKRGQSVFYSSIEFGKATNLVGSESIAENEKIIVFTGIANPDPFIDYLKDKYTVIDSKRFPDHWNYSKTDIQHLIEEAEAKGCRLITTEKDAIKLMSKPFVGILKDHKESVYYFPIKMNLIEKGKEFEGMVFDSLKS